MIKSNRSITGTSRYTFSIPNITLGNNNNNVIVMFPMPVGVTLIKMAYESYTSAVCRKTIWFFESLEFPTYHCVQKNVNMKTIEKTGTQNVRKTKALGRAPTLIPFSHDFWNSGRPLVRRCSCRRSFVIFFVSRIYRFRISYLSGSEGCAGCPISISIVSFVIFFSGRAATGVPNSGSCRRSQKLR